MHGAAIGFEGDKGSAFGALGQRVDLTTDWFVRCAADRECRDTVGKILKEEVPRLAVPRW